MAKPTAITEGPPHGDRPLPLVRLGVVVAVATAVGAAVGMSFGARSPAGTTVTRAAALPVGNAPVATVERDRSLEQAIDALTVEVRRLAERLDRPAATREAVAASESAPPEEAASWIAALERAAAALTRAAERSGGFATAGVRVPLEPLRADLLRPMLSRSAEELCVEHAFWSTQRVLDTYGRPTSVWDGSIHYRIDGEGTIVFKIGESGYVHGVQPR